MNWQYIFTVGKNNTNLHQNIYLIILGDMSEHRGILSRSAGFVSLLFSKRKRKTYGITERKFSPWVFVFDIISILFFLSILVWYTSKPLQPQFWNYALRFDTQWIEDRSSFFWSFDLAGTQISLLIPKSVPTQIREHDHISTIFAQLFKTGRVGLTSTNYTNTILL